MKKIKISSKANIPKILDKFKRSSYEYRLPEEDRLILITEVESRIHYLFEKGNEMLNLGIRFRVKQTIMSLIVLDADFQPQQKTLLSRLRILMGK